MRVGKQHNDGFTLIEVVLVMMMISLISIILGMPYLVEATPSLSLATDAQLEAMALRRTVWYQQGLSFNHRGNINQAQSINVSGRRCVFQVGMGRYYCE